MKRIALCIALATGAYALFAHWYDPAHGLQRASPVFIMSACVLLQMLVTRRR